MTPSDARFVRAYLATSYVLGERDAPWAGEVSPQVAQVRAALAAAERPERARALAAELAQLALALEHGGLR